MTKFTLEKYIDMTNLNDQNTRYTKFFFHYVKYNVYDGKEIDVDDFSKLSIENLINSLHNYMYESSSISKRTASQYIGSINKLFEHLEQFYQIKSDIYINGDFILEFKEKYAVLLSLYIDAQDTDTASEDEYNKLLSIVDRLECDYSFDEAVTGINRCIENHSLNSLSMFSTIRSVCATRLVLECGLKNDEISSMRINDIDLENSIIKRGRYQLKISYKLKNDLYEYFRVRKYLLSKTNKQSDMVFLDHIGEPIPNGDVAKKLLEKTISQVKSGQSGSTYFARRFITKMIIEGLNIATIRELTGHGDKTCLSICNFVNSNYLDFIQKEVFQFAQHSNMPQTKKIIKGHFICLKCKEIKQAEEAVLIKKPNNDTLYLYCLECAEKEKAKFGGTPNE